ncbi:MAG: hypothetical protein CVT49_08065 [candidate division Zixibacteria bacterium HGW-Zixibacteria-1]|nr:MAG: hypothetical protein CVT49_08065 [candidate division Zixibacteria bacterium HGW-Zixibacteria-1]
MRKYFFSLFSAMGLSLLLTWPSAAQTKIEFQAAEGFTDNLFLDTNAVEDTYTTNKASISMYPGSFLELRLKNEYTYYSTRFNLSNFKGDIGFTLLPLSDASAFSLYLYGNFGTQVYRVAYQHFSSDNYDLAAGLGYTLGEAAQLRVGWNFNDAEYSHELPEVVDTTDMVISPFPPFDTTVYTEKKYGMVADNRNQEFYIGGNFTFWGCNVIDVEAGYARKYLSYVEKPDRLYLRPEVDNFVDGKLEAYYISPRFSRSIGDKIGLKVTYTYRSLSGDDNIVVPGISTDFLSPWASVYEGDAITMAVKTFLIPNFIATIGAAYWDKEFLMTEQYIEDNDNRTPPIQIRGRHDYQSKVFLSFQRPFPLHLGSLIEPAIQFDYSDNNSSNELYNYTNFSVLLALKARF